MKAVTLSLCLLAQCLLLSSCVSTVVGVAAGTALTVGTLAVKVPVKAGGMVVDGLNGEDDEDED